ncbi:MAG: ABC transporter ATP-binding protein [Thermoleophilia bacterium]|nr:ABC transporter ATP-binding protein [Thermoleophilia bacterium]
MSATGVRLAYDGTEVVRGADLELRAGEVVAVVGPNASGKSTLLRGMARLMRPTAGTVVLDGGDIRRRPTREVARMLGLLPQHPVAPEAITVAELVERGRHPHRGWLTAGRGDREAVASALEATGTADLAHRAVDTLSGGQRQRVWIAMALAQEPEVLLLDEPISFLDVAHQIDVLDLLAEVNARRGTTIAMVLHDLNLASRYAHRLAVVAGGRVIATGTPDEVLTLGVLREAFGLDARLMRCPVSGMPIVVPVGRFPGAPG